MDGERGREREKEKFCYSFVLPKILLLVLEKIRLWHSCGMLKIQAQGSSVCHGSDNTGSLTCRATRELQEEARQCFCHTPRHVLKAMGWEQEVGKGQKNLQSILYVSGVQNKVSTPEILQNDPMGHREKTSELLVISTCYLIF